MQRTSEGSGAQQARLPMRARSMLSSVAVGCTALTGSAAAQSPPVIYVGQGASWTPATRASIYSQDQGSSMIPYNWLAALKQPNGQPFLADSLARYGYLTTRRTPTGFRSGSRSPGRPARRSPA